MKLASLLSESMRELSHIWAPPIYRRLLSLDKRERDMSERCLLKIKSTILPPPLNLSKVLTCSSFSSSLTSSTSWLSHIRKKFNMVSLAFTILPPPLNRSTIMYCMPPLAWPSHVEPRGVFLSFVLLVVSRMQMTSLSLKTDNIKLY